jgi:hypothetical protein
MPNHPNPTNSLTRILSEVERIIRWAERSGTEQQKKIAADLLVLIKHLQTKFTTNPVE